MFIFTAKLSRGRAVAAVLLLAVIIACVILLAGRRSDAVTAGEFDAVVKSNSQRVEYLESLGWQVSAEPIEEQAVIIPRTFSQVYEDYNELQKSQGFDLKKYCGCEAIRYSYSVTNYPGEDGAVIADLLIYRGRVIAGDVQSASINGFMQGLKFPK